jgi:hypothetical protein
MFLPSACRMYTAGSIHDLRGMVETNETGMLHQFHFREFIFLARSKKDDRG